MGWGLDTGRGGFAAKRPSPAIGGALHSPEPARPLPPPLTDWIVPMTRNLVAYLSTVVVFLAIDMVWLGVVAREFYKSRLGDLLLAQPNWGVALGFYALYVVGVVLFVVAPALTAGWSLATTALWGAAFGFFAYATYDLTNLATIRNWPVSITFVDLAWGTVLTAVSATAGVWLTRKFLGL